MSSAEVVVGCDDLLNLIVGFVCEPEILLTSLVVVNRKFHDAVYRCATWSISLRFSSALFSHHHFIIAGRAIRALLAKESGEADQKTFVERALSNPSPRYETPEQRKERRKTQCIAAMNEW